jgi:hypothetical protein
MKGNDRVSTSATILRLSSAEFIRDALRSALAQSRVDCEIVVQKPMSTDSTHQAIREFNDGSVRLIIEPDDGQADALVTLVFAREDIRGSRDERNYPAQPKWDRRDCP